MTAASMLAAVGAGGLVGFTLGLIGGGSILATPLLLYVLGVADPHVAIGTGALAVSVSAYANLVHHACKGHVWWRCAIVFAVVGTAGAMAGSCPGLLVDGRSLLFLFGLVMIAATGMPTISAIGSSLLAVGTFGLATALTYARAGLVDWRLAAEFILGCVVGGAFGVLLATRLSTSKAALDLLFAALVLVVAACVVVVANIPRSI